MNNNGSTCKSQGNFEEFIFKTEALVDQWIHGGCKVWTPCRTAHEINFTKVGSPNFFFQNFFELCKQYKECLFSDRYKAVKGYLLHAVNSDFFGSKFCNPEHIQRC